MLFEWEISIPELTAEKKRKAYIYLPVGYGKTERRYPVMYMSDGQNLFSDEESTYGKCWGLADYLDYTETDLIVAAVECNTEGFGRLSEYSPVSFTTPDGVKISGKCKKYMDWLVGEFKPFIDKNYLTLPGRRDTAIGGSSLGGLTALYAVSKYNKYFSKGAALSPSLWVNPGRIAGLVRNSAYGKGTVIYADYGSREFANHPQQREAFAGLCSALIKKGVYLTSRIVPDGVHSEESWGKQIPYFLNTLGFYPKN